MRLLNKKNYKKYDSVIVPGFDEELVLGYIATAKKGPNGTTQFTIMYYYRSEKFIQDYGENELILIDPDAIDDLNEDDCVYLTNPDPGYEIDESNPAVGTRHQCRGYVIDFPDDDQVEVEWANGVCNVYTDYELCKRSRLLDTLVNAKENGRYVSIWPLK